MNHTFKIWVANLDDCRESDVILDLGGGAQNIDGISYSQAAQALLYGLVIESKGSYQIIRMDWETRKRVFLATGFNPGWSPDSQWIAYVLPDGIYVMKADGSEPRQVVSHVIDTSFVGAPIPQWSPDGKWIIYHLCDKNDCMYFENTIYKTEVATGLQQKLIEGGAYPDWRP